MGEILLIGFLMDLLKGILAFAGAWGILYLADKANGIDLRDQLDNMTTGQGAYYGLRWLAVAYILGAIFL